MRKLILISAFALASFAAQAGESRSLILASNDTAAPAATTATVAPEAAAAPAAATETAKPAASKKQVSSGSKKTARRETDGQKARRIAARYGVYW